MPTRRDFLASLAVPAAAAAAPRLSRAESVAREIAADRRTAAEVAGDEDFWAHVATAFTVDRSVVNFNNGGVSPSPAFVQEAVKRHLDYSNSSPPPLSLWQTLEPQKEGVRQRLARHWGVDPEEIAITRNASESLQTCQFGIDLRAGDEILTTTHDYGRMLTTFRQRERREGVVMKQISLPVPGEDPAEIVRRFREAITERTRLILICHVVNISGLVMPVREIVSLARSAGGQEIPVIVDGAHALAHLNFKISDLGCDYYGVSLHKWLFAPHGTGLLYVRREKIPGVWPLMASEAKNAADIRKFEEIGTHPAAQFLAIGEALTFHQAIGDDRKEARLRHLRDAWTRPLLERTTGRRVTLHSPRAPAMSCGIGTFEIEGIEPLALQQHLWLQHRILLTGVDPGDFRGTRVTPSVYNTREEIERFVDAVTAVMDRGLPDAP